MRDKLIFIPFQDENCLISDGILTREYAWLLMLDRAGYKLAATINKPRTLLDEKKLSPDYTKFPQQSYEREALELIKRRASINPRQSLSVTQVLKKRCWWEDGYLRAIEDLQLNINNCIVYSNTPFSWKLLSYLKSQGAVVFFDTMDNMAIYPHFKSYERERAYQGYSEILKFADVVCVNSDKTQSFFQERFKTKVPVIRNGVFEPRYCDATGLQIYQQICEAKKGYRAVAGFIGKMCLRIDARLLNQLAKAVQDCLILLIGPDLAGQTKEIDELVKRCSNVKRLEPVPSAYLYSIYDLFDYLILPYTVDVNENSGDPLKLYQYLMTDKPVISTGVSGMAAYADTILVSNEIADWIGLLSSEAKPKDYGSVHSSILWESRAEPILKALEGASQ